MKIAVKNEFKIGNIFFQLKDRIEVEKMSDVVYNVPCVYWTNFTTNSQTDDTA